MSFDLTGFTLIKLSIFVLLLAWVVLKTKKHYAEKLLWKESAFIVLSSMLLTVLSGTIISIILIFILQRWVNGEPLETIVLIVSLSAMYVVFKPLQSRFEARFLKDNLNNDN